MRKHTVYIHLPCQREQWGAVGPTSAIPQLRIAGGSVGGFDRYDDGWLA